MDMNSNLQLALRVAGTKQRRAGFAPLVTVGVLAGDEGANMYRSTMVAERPAYVVKHAPTYILYQLIDRGAKPFDADANGVLSIALTISSNSQLAEGKSPFTLLDEVYKKFVETYMESTSDGRLSFIDTDNDNEIFREIVSQYKLEPRRSSYVTMSQQGLTGVVCVPQDKLVDFFANTQYKEFAQFKDIEIGISCAAQVTPGLENLQIPLPPNVFDIWVNGKPVGTSMQSLTDKYIATAERTKYYSYESAEFSLAELLEAPMNRITKNGASISLDYQKNRISCDLKKIDVYYNFVYDWTDNIGGAKGNIIQFAKLGKVKLYLGSEDISQSLWTNCKIKASDIRGRKVEIKPQTVGNYSLYPLSEIDESNRQIATRIIINLRAISSGQNNSRTLPPARVPERPTTKKEFDNEEYFKKGTKQSETKPELNHDNKKLDIKSFILGVLIGLIIGLGAWGAYSMLSGKDTPSPQPDPQPVYPTDSVPESQELTQTVLSTEEVKELDVTVTEEQEKKKQEEDAKRIQEEEAKKKLLAEQKAKEKEVKAQARKDILALVNRKNLQAIRATKGIENILSTQELSAVEAVLYMKQYKGATKKNVEKLLKDKTFNSFEEVVATQKQIWKIMNEEQVTGN